MSEEGRKEEKGKEREWEERMEGKKEEVGTEIDTSRKDPVCLYK